ncbi:MAG: alpha-L-fucosidase [Candidatus Anammoximicrobium sp.]|nr:alpha-L-fucosidase [Candidatus Anammoximicrobium sp.]
MRACCFAAMLPLLFAGAAPAVESAAPPQPFGALPTDAHLAWHELEYYGFIHFTLNTFTDREWGNGDESPQRFNPGHLDAEQWARVAKESGMKGLILTAKHHDGFCLWPSRYTEHSVKNSPWKNGQGDVVKACADACRKHGLKFGAYLSPWDRNHAQYARPAYVQYYRNQLRELLTNYGEIFETWYDGANGGTGYYGGANERRTIDNRTYYEWPQAWALVRELQPGCIRFSDGGPDIRWVGNERGLGYDPNWATFDREGRWPGISVKESLWHGDRGGTHWVPAECDVSIRPGWFWHESQNDKVKTLDQLLEIYYASVGQGCNLLLNIPPDRRGLFHENDVARLLELGRVLQDTFRTDLARGKPVTASNVRSGAECFDARRVTDGDRRTYWAADDDVREATLEVDLGGKVEFDRVRLQEHIPLGQRVEAFEVAARVGGQWQTLAQAQTIGPRRILRMDRVQADRLRVKLTKCLACPTLATIEVYNSPSAAN